MGKRGRSKYNKALARLIDTGETQPTLVQAYEAMKEWLEGVPWAYMSPQGREKFEQVVVDEAFRRVAEYFRKLIETRAKRVRPAYRKVWDYITELFAERRLDWLIQQYELSPQKLYRDIAKELGLSWRTVRDAFWAVREVLGI